MDLRISSRTHFGSCPEGTVVTVRCRRSRGSCLRPSSRPLDLCWLDRLLTGLPCQEKGAANGSRQPLDVDCPAVTYSPRGLLPKYHRRCRVSLPCSEWERVVPRRSSHRTNLRVTRATRALHSEHVSVDSNPSPRPISTGPLNALLRLHVRPINLVFYQGP